ncbi:MAG TPA: DUF952 domain-containing protein [Thermomicrobiales bacterium]|nr:DUF952 domain-containing protein [Thermomicrobiales bacterium]
MANQRIPGPAPAGVTLHLTPEPVWRAQRSLPEYRPEGFAAGGFIHNTDGETEVLAVANRYYRGDARPYLLLDVDLARVTAPAIYEDAARRYPHIYGPIPLDAVLRVRRVERAPDGAFTAIGDVLEDAGP